MSGARPGGTGVRVVGLVVLRRVAAVRVLFIILLIVVVRGGAVVLVGVGG